MTRKTSKVLRSEKIYEYRENIGLDILEEGAQGIPAYNKPIKLI